MLKKKMIRKIIIATGALFALFLIYLIPNENVNDLESKQELEYINLDVKTNPIFLLNSNNYLGRCEIVINSNNPTNQIKELLQVLISGGEGENRIPNGFKSILPSDTKILSIDLNDGIVKINFSKELLLIRYADFFISEVISLSISFSLFRFLIINKVDNANKITKIGIIIYHFFDFFCFVPLFCKLIWFSFIFKFLLSHKL